ncbi:hypothetical protein [Hahella ganghwensis]|uniref:hypothetical protein n=1 Tax=Hahella ganghwensis TaxID=286420 RepID=UPI000381BD31|nr:hypothetical protein [Hahella ganghwensis]
MQQRLNIGWKVSTLNIELASLRYRAMLPILALEKYAIKSKILACRYQGCLSNIDVLVIVKSFTEEDILLAQEAESIGIPVIFDLCDNIFIQEYGEAKTSSPAKVFNAISRAASAIVVTTEPLAQIVRNSLEKDIPVHVIPDGIETDELLKHARRRLRLVKINSLLNWAVVRQAATSIHRHLVRSVRSKLGSRKKLTFKFWLKLAYQYYDKSRSSVRSLFQWSSPTQRVALAGEKRGLSSELPTVDRLPRLEKNQVDRGSESEDCFRILWFGNHGAAHASFGMLDILIIRDALERIAKDLPVKLQVISNNVSKYEEFIRPMAITTQYIEWSATNFRDYLGRADVVIVPNSLDPFSVCKSSNRTVLSLCHGVPVVATRTPALRALESCIILDDFEEGIRRYLTDKSLVKSHIEEGKALIASLYGQSEIGSSWKRVFEDVSSRMGELKKKSNPELIFLVNLPQDIDLVKPLIDVAIQKQLTFAVWTSLGAIKSWPQIAQFIHSSEFDWRVLNDFPGDLSDQVLPSSTHTMLAVTETSLRPHQFSHNLVELANKKGLYTATLQHGFENVGLSYSDDIHAISRVSFASKKIYTWGEVDTLHDEVSSCTRLKCFPVGCPKPLHVDKSVPFERLVANKIAIGIFENLHWHRYSDGYRAFFLDGIDTVAKAFPDILFVIKPHAAGKWFTDRYLGTKPESDNLIVLNSKDSRWCNLSAPQMLENLAAVITSPSTVALDASRVGLPTAVVGECLELSNYSPLPMIRKDSDWLEFINRVMDAQGRMQLEELARAFDKRVLLPSGNAAEDIINDIVSNRPKAGAKHVS